MSNDNDAGAPCINMDAKEMQQQHTSSLTSLRWNSNAEHAAIVPLPLFVAT
jgi:hypothetical protein